MAKQVFNLYRHTALDRRKAMPVIGMLELVVHLAFGTINVPGRSCTKFVEETCETVKQTFAGEILTKYCHCS